MNLGLHAYTALDQVDSGGHRQWTSIDAISDPDAPDVIELGRVFKIKKGEG
jgi:hypothetical protein